MTLTGRQKRALRALGQRLQPVVEVGATGLGPAVAAALDAALEDHELIKVRMRQPDDKRALAAALAEAGRAELCGLVGHTVLLYRRHPERPRVALPEPDAG